MTDAITPAPVVAPVAPVVAPVAPVVDPAAAVEPLPPQTLHPHVIAPDVDNAAPVVADPVAVDAQGIATLTAQFDTFRTESAAREQGFQQTIQTLMTRPAVAAAPVVQPTAPATLNFDGLPDPIVNLKDFKAQLATTVASHITQAGESAQQGLLAQVNRASALDRLWNQFNGSHTELAKRPALARGAADMEFAALRAQGIDPVAVAQSDPDSIIANIAARMTAELGTAAVPPVVPAVPGAVPSVARVADIAGATAPAAPLPAIPKPASFVSQLKKLQLADGFL